MFLCLISHNSRHILYYLLLLAAWTEQCRLLPVLEREVWPIPCASDYVIVSPLAEQCRSGC